MKNIIMLRQTGGSVGFSLTKILKKERLDWELGDYFTFSVVDKNEVILRRLELKKKGTRDTKKVEQKSV
jgi:hypothetical protein